MFRAKGQGLRVAGFRVQSVGFWARLFRSVLEINPKQWFKFFRQAPKLHGCIEVGL